MKNILKFLFIALLLINLSGCMTVLKQIINNELSINIAPNETFSIGDVEDEDVQKSPPSNYNPDIDYLQQNTNIEIQNLSDRRLILLNNADKHVIESQKSVTITLKKRSVFTINNPYQEVVNIGIKYPLTYNFKYKKQSKR